MLAQRSRHLYRSTMGVLAVNIITSGVITLGISAGAGVALGWGALRVSQGTLALPTLLVVLMLGVEVFRPLRELSRLYHRGMIAVSTAKAILLSDAVPRREPRQPRCLRRTADAHTSAVRLGEFWLSTRSHVLHNVSPRTRTASGIVGQAVPVTDVDLAFALLRPQRGVSFRATAHLALRATPYGCGHAGYLSRAWTVADNLRFGEA
jgi:ABC-type transport system involved in cytochrome bd biosynthesis fused ATPase/permease subunit